MQCYLGIDGGGSGSRWALLDESGVVRMRGGDGPSLQAAQLGVAETASRLTGILRDVRAKMASESPAEEDCDAAPTPAKLVLGGVVIGLAGVGDANTRRALASQIATGDARVVITGDTITGAAAALGDGPGVAVFAGTGSFAIARDESGRLHRVGGRGSEASDHGSGYRVVRSAAEAALLSVDGLGPRTSLEEVVATGLGVADPRWIGSALKEQDTRSIAGCFPDVVRAAVAGDGEARRILREGAAGLVRLAVAAADRAGLERSVVVITLGGGTMSSPDYYREVEGQLRSEGLRGRVRPLPRPSEEGGAVLALAAVQGRAPLCEWLDG